MSFSFEKSNELLGQSLTLALRERRLKDAAEIARLIVDKKPFSEDKNQTDTILLDMASKLLVALEQKGFTKEAALQSDVLHIQNIVQNMKTYEYQQSQSQNQNDEKEAAASCTFPGSFPRPSSGKCPDDHIELDSNDMKRKCCMPLKKLREDLKLAPTQFFQNQIMNDLNNVNNVNNQNRWTTESLWPSFQNQNIQMSYGVSAFEPVETRISPQLAYEFAERFNIYDVAPVKQWLEPQINQFIPDMEARQTREQQHKDAEEDQKLVFSGTLPSKKQNILRDSLDMQSKALEHALEKEESKPNGQPWTIVSLSPDLYTYLKQKAGSLPNFIKWFFRNDWSKWYFALQLIKVMISLVCLAWKGKGLFTGFFTLWFGTQTSAGFLALVGTGVTNVALSYLSPFAILFVMKVIQTLLVQLLGGGWSNPGAVFLTLVNAVMNSIYPFFNNIMYAWSLYSMWLNGWFFVELVSLVFELIASGGFGLGIFSSQNPNAWSNLFLSDTTFEKVTENKETKETYFKPGFRTDQDQYEYQYQSQTNEKSARNIMEQSSNDLLSQANKDKIQSKSVEAMSSVDRFMYHLCNSKLVFSFSEASKFSVNMMLGLEKYVCMLIADMFGKMQGLGFVMGKFCDWGQTITSWIASAMDYFFSGGSFGSLFTSSTRLGEALKYSLSKFNISLFQTATASIFSNTLGSMQSIINILKTLYPQGP